MKSNFKSLTMVFTALAIICTTTLVSCEKDATLTGKSSAQNDTAIAQANNVEINLNQNDRELFAKSLAKRFANESLSFSELNNADRKSTRLNSSHNVASRMPSSA